MGETFLGVMSGTSLDGIDLVLAHIEGATEQAAIRLEAFQYQAFSAEMRDHLWQLLKAPSLPPGEILAAHGVLGRLFGEAVTGFLAENGLGAEAVTAIGLHGLTFHHQPEATGALGGTARGSWQLGDPHLVRQITGIPVVSDFRGADMAVGGQGAPLVPFLDRLLFAHDRETRVLLNLGGIANATFLIPGRPVSAFDTGPANMLIDGLMRRHPSHPAERDEHGHRAALGHEIPAILNRCLAHPYFAMAAPKSTGRELFGEAFLSTYFQGHAHDDLVATATRLSARSVGDAVKTFLDGRAGDVLICAGGGTHNRTLMGMLVEELAGMRVTTTAEYGLAEDAKEGLLMAVLAWAHWHKLPANIPGVTGADHPVVLGSLTP